MIVSHRPITPSKIGWPSHVSCPQSDGTLAHDGEWFFSLLHCYVSCAEWDHTPSSFYRPTPKGGVIYTAYRLTFRSHLITAASLRHLITVGSTHLRSNGPRSSRSHLFRYLPPSRLRHLLSWSDGWSFTLIQLIHLPCSPHPLTVPCAQRKKVTGSPVPVAVAPQQPYLTNSMAKGKKEKVGSCNYI